MTRWLLLLVLVTTSLGLPGCAARRRPPNDEITILLTAPEEEPVEAGKESTALE